MRLPPPLPGLQNVLSSHHQIVSYISSSGHVLLPDTIRLPVEVHAAKHGVLAYAGTHVFLESSKQTIRVPQKLHFRPLNLALRVNKSEATVVIAGPDGAYCAKIDLSNAQVGELFVLPGSNGYTTVCVAINENFVAAASVDGRLALWQDLHAAACMVVDVVDASADRITDITFVDDGILIAWWSGRLVHHSLGASRKGKKGVIWDLRVVQVGQENFGKYAGCYVCVKESFIAFATGRGDLLFVRLSDGAHVVKKVGAYIKGMCNHHDKLKLVVDGCLTTHKWITATQLDKEGLPIPMKKLKKPTQPKKVKSYTPTETDFPEIS